jgi:hypothetical protein
MMIMINPPRGISTRQVTQRMGAAVLAIVIVG